MHGRHGRVVARVQLDGLGAAGGEPHSADEHLQGGGRRAVVVGEGLPGHKAINVCFSAAPAPGVNSLASSVPVTLATTPRDAAGRRSGRTTPNPGAKVLLASSWPVRDVASYRQLDTVRWSGPIGEGGAGAACA